MQSCKVSIANPRNTAAFSTAFELNADANFYDYRARYYDPSVGRFISDDPLRFWSGSNFYAYVHNNPARFLDPFGKDWTDWIPGVHWLKCKTWGYYCLKVVFEKRQEELAHPSTYTNDELANPQDEGVRLIRRCAKNDDNCKKWLDQCGDDILGGLKDGMFPH